MEKEKGGEGHVCYTDVLMYLCAHVFMCSCIHVLMYSCAHVVLMWWKDRRVRPSWMGIDELVCTHE